MPQEDTSAPNQIQPAEALAPPRVEIELELDPTVNFAMQQNDVPVIKALRVVNRGEAELRELTVRLWSDPEFAAPWEARVERLAAGGVHNLGMVDLPLSSGWLARLTERVAGAIHAEVWAGEAVLAAAQRPIQVLAFDEWSGLRSLPEILAAFVLPNHPAVEAILGRAAGLLGQWTGDSSLSGYQSRSRERALQIAGAIYAALGQEGISYINPPASFESEGQKIRLPDRILEKRLGTCLDLAALAAACLEQAGLFPLLVITEGHAFAGVWLEEECFADSATDDALRLRKRVELGEICVFETTLLTGGQPAEFSQAVTTASRHLDDASKFRCAIDIQRCRKSRIRPLPVRAGGEVALDQADVRRPIAQPGASGLSLDAVLPATATGSRINGASSGQAETPATRLDNWKRKLLDLSFRNRLLNFKETKKTLPILCPDLPALEDALSDGMEFRIQPKPAELESGQPRSAELHLARTGQDPLEALLREEFKAKRLRAGVTPADLERRMLEIYRAARGSIEEGGANTLYLALGFLAYYESKQSEQRRLAPIILIPVELTRRSVQEGFRIRQGDDEPQVNVTLLEMLRSDYQLDIPGMDPVPQDEKGVDVRGILTAFRQKIKEIDRWEVVEEAQIGQFSFTKFLMWRDLQARTADLLQSKVVSHLVNRPTEAYPQDGTFPDSDKLDETHKPEATFCPLLADSSQLAAVHAAAEGKTFVLEGPPGTGKSQTITNLIAHTLAMGKSVLFVSEKRAALSVVHHRLKQVGLEPFCLELHSNKTHKLEVIKQLGQALEAAGMRSSGEWEREAARLGALRKDLNTYVEALHRPRATGESVFQGTSRLIGLREAREVPLQWDSAEAFTREELDRLRDIVDRMQVAGQTCGGAHGNPWAASDLREWSPALEREAGAALPRLAECCAQLAEAARAAAPAVELPAADWSLGGYDFLFQLAQLLLSAPPLTSALLTEPDWDAIQSALAEWIRRGRLRDALRNELYNRYTEGLLALDLEALTLKLDQARSTWFLPAWLRRRAVRGALKAVAKGGQVPAAGELEADLKKARQLRDEEKALAASGDRARQLLGQLWKEGEPDWGALEQVSEWSARFRTLARRAAGADLDRAAALRARWARLATEGRELLQPGGPTHQLLQAYARAYNEFMKEKQSLESLLALDAAAAWGGTGEAGALARAQAMIKTWRENLGELRAWSQWRVVRQDALNARLGPLVAAYEQGKAATGELSPAFERGFYQWWVEELMQREPALKGFFSPEHERKIQQFRDLDDRYTQLARAEIQARLAARVPTPGERVSENSEMGVLQRQLQLKTRHLPVRTLFQRVPNLLPRLKPCLLMSPLSVAQYLDAGHPAFDLVVFDEASQIPVWDAVGAIARGREAIIVGDPKQLPPTSFFSRADEQELGDDDTLEDLESILDDCLGAGLPKRRLIWHYRSRHESLIAFSNHHYYEDRLLTFPSPHQGMGVQWKPVAGAYDQGGSRTNKAEAEAVVAEILRRLRDPDLSRHSIGVVTFSVAQQGLVEDLLEAARRDNPEIEPFFDDETAAEPVFVKNLENVQGDERDVILFSICYGPNAQGKVSMNFGPLNRDGGERRLNVAITRARREVLVFSTLRADQIDLTRTRARGVGDLKAFLDYAERGPKAIAEAASASPDAQFESPFEQQVGEALRRRGRQVHLQVGCSGYRIDLAVVDPDAPGRYLLGIECDGANYHRARTARDRDRLRQAVLEDLGWRLHRVWSSDWWANPTKELDKIEAAIARAGRDSRRAPTPVQETARAQEAAPERIAAAPLRPIPEPVTATATAALPAAPPPAAAPALPVYQPFPVGRKQGSSDDFMQPRADAAIRSLIEAVVKQEGPVSLDLLARRVAAHWEVGRMTARMVQRVKDQAARAGVQKLAHGEQVFYWPAALKPADYRDFRIPGDAEETSRKADDLPPEEVANAARCVLEQAISLPLADLVRDTARLLGYQRTGAAVDRAMRAGIQLLCARGGAREQEGLVIHQS